MAWIEKTDWRYVIEDGVYPNPLRRGKLGDRAAETLARIRAHMEKSAEPPRENAALLGEANQAINTMLELWAAHTSSPPASRADEIERALNRVRLAAARVSRALKEKFDG